MLSHAHHVTPMPPMCPPMHIQVTSATSRTAEPSGDIETPPRSTLPGGSDSQRRLGSADRNASAVGEPTAIELRGIVDFMCVSAAAAAATAATAGAPSPSPAAAAATSGNRSRAGSNNNLLRPPAATGQLPSFSSSASTSAATAALAFLPAGHTSSRMAPAEPPHAAQVRTLPRRIGRHLGLHLCLSCRILCRLGLLFVFHAEPQALLYNGIAQMQQPQALVPALSSARREALGAVVSRLHAALQGEGTENRA